MTDLMHVKLCSVCSQQKHNSIPHELGVDGGSQGLGPILTEINSK